MRSLLLVTCCVAGALLMPEPVSATVCDTICSTTVLWGHGSSAIKYVECQCTGTTGVTRTGPNCSCGGCYVKQGTKVFGYVKEANGQCTTGYTNCLDCDIESLSSSGSGSSNVTTTPTPTTSSPASNSTESGSTSGSSDSSSGLDTWQIALIICSCVLVIAVIMVTITSCYCKARNRMNDNIQMEAESREYENYWHPGGSGDDRAGDTQINNSSFGPSLTQGGRSSFTSNQSRPNSTKNVPYSEATYVVDGSDRIGGMGRTNRQSLGSNADLPGVYQPFPPRDRPSHEVGSRKNIAIEL